MFHFIEENAEPVKQAFSMFDEQCTGTIPTNRLGTVIRCLGFNPTEKDLEDLINQVDADSNGVIDFIEFLEMMQQIWCGDSETIREAFQMFDSDGSGTIDLKEFKKAIQAYSPTPIDGDEVAEMVTQVDSNGDGCINLEEFVMMLKS